MWRTRVLTVAQRLQNFYQWSDVKFWPIWLKFGAVSYLLSCTKAKKYLRFYCLIYKLWLKENWIQACTQWIPLLETPLFYQLWLQPTLWKRHRVDKVGNFPPWICSDREIDNSLLLPINNLISSNCQMMELFYQLWLLETQEIFDIFHIMNR